MKSRPGPGARDDARHDQDPQGGRRQGDCEQRHPDESSTAPSAIAVGAASRQGTICATVGSAKSDAVTTPATRPGGMPSTQQMKFAATDE
ncbi:hypothetical protein AX769_06185 [Frondihabitans sp. PAMC 28766]|uniref:hypothetical protein n=1 Tax=Frondihabitans sp. PAMC 28766 TaxID=1795630 RepID=UPI00078C1EEB|nr:hypothetical protein [Frondihabitans sp. PAMC 28766]AMM19817.1 hypothetical protein AX769_06185 [Frondihabitans sp. PAMC 28766]